MTFVEFIESIGRVAEKLKGLPPVFEDPDPEDFDVIVEFEESELASYLHHGKTKKNFQNLPLAEKIECMIYLMVKASLNRDMWEHMQKTVSRFRTELKQKQRDGDCVVTGIPFALDHQFEL